MKRLSKEDLQDLGFNDEEIEALSEQGVVIEPCEPWEFPNKFIIWCGCMPGTEVHITSLEDLRIWITGLKEYADFLHDMSKDEKEIIMKLYSEHSGGGSFDERLAMNEANEILCRFREEHKDRVIPDSITPSLLYYYWFTALKYILWDDFDYFGSSTFSALDSDTNPFSDFEKGSEGESDKS